MQDRLFAKFDSHSAIENSKTGLLDSLRKIQESELKGTEIEAWANFFVEKYKIAVPVIDRGTIESETEDVQLDAKRFHDRMHYGYDSEPVATQGTEVRFHVPFTGEPLLFGCTGNTLMATFPIVEVERDKLIFTYQTVDHDVNGINSKFDRDLSTVESHLRTLENAFRDFNQSIEPTVRAKIGERLAKFKKDAELGSQLKYPVKKRSDAPGTYKVPEIKRTAMPRPLPPVASPNPPDPALEMDHYDHIIGVVKNMVRVMECSPKAFKALGEEDLRFHFLVQLNGQYEGMASGETFNYQGKTDIIIKYNGHNLFVAECKFWKGPKGYTETIDQILKYVSWRETKAALFIFCQDTDPSVPAQKIPDETAKHPNYLKALKYGDGSSFRYLFKHPGDATKELFLTVLIFNIPK